MYDYNFSFWGTEAALILWFSTIIINCVDFISSGGLLITWENFHALFKNFTLKNLFVCKILNLFHMHICCGVSSEFFRFQKVWKSSMQRRPYLVGYQRGQLNKSREGWISSAFIYGEVVSARVRIKRGSLSSSGRVRFSLNSCFKLLSPRAFRVWVALVRCLFHPYSLTM